MTPLTVALAALVVASGADVATTRAGLCTGALEEQNPLMRWGTRTTLRAIVMKLVGLGIATVALRAMPPIRATWAAWLCAGWVLSTAWRNYRLLRFIARDVSVSKSLQ